MAINIGVHLSFGVNVLSLGTYAKEQYDLVILEFYFYFLDKSPHMPLCTVDFSTMTTKYSGLSTKVQNTEGIKESFLFFSFGVRGTQRFWGTKQY